MKKGTAYVDGGGIKGKPCAAGCRLIVSHHILPITFEVHAARSLGSDLTNNDAEYYAVILGMEMALKYECTFLMLYSDSKLIVNQLKGQYKITKKHLRAHFDTAVALACEFDDGIAIEWVSRKNNKVSDALCWEAKDYDPGYTIERVEMETLA